MLYYKKINLIKKLLKSGANFLIPNLKGISAKDLAKKKGLSKVVNIFQKKIESNRGRSKDFQKVYEKSCVQESIVVSFMAN